MQHSNKKSVFSTFNSYLSEATAAVEMAQEDPHHPWSFISEICPGHSESASKERGKE